MLNRLRSLLTSKKAPDLSFDWKEVMCPGQKQKIANVIVDVQYKYCASEAARNDATDKAASGIAEIVPTFRKESITNYWVYVGDRNTIEKNDFYIAKPKDVDRLFCKQTASAFENRDFSESAFDSILTRDGKKILLFSGVNLSACVAASAMGAQEKGYKAIILSDLSANNGGFKDGLDEEARSDLRNRGIPVVTSKEVLQHLNL